MTLDSLDPEFKKKIEQLIIELSLRGINCAVTSTRRTIKEQDALYAQGRTKPGKIITKAKGGQSPHNFGLAADLCPYKPGTKELWWNCPDDLWHVIQIVSEGMGLDSGYDWNFQDCPHVQDRNWKQVQAKWKAGELQIA